MDLDHLIAEMTSGFALHEMLFDGEGNPEDYRYIRVNSLFCRLTGLDEANIIGRTVRELFPDIEPRWLQRYGQLVRDGNPLVFEDTLSLTGLYCEVRAWRPAPGYFISLFNDQTRRRKIEQALVESEQRYHFAIEAVDDAVWDFDRERGSVYWSTKYFTMLGYRPGELNPSLEQLIQLLHPRDRSIIKEAFDRCESGETDSLFETVRFGTRKGDYRWIETKGRVLNRSAEGRVLRIVGTNRDVHNLTEARILIRDQEDLFRSIYEQAMVGIAVLDSKGKFLRANGRFCDICGYQEQELITLKYTDITDPEDLETELIYIAEMQEGLRDTFVLEKRYRHKAGRTVWILLYAKATRKANRKVDKVFAIVNDITSRREAEQALLESRTQLMKQNQEYIRINEELSKQKVLAEESDRLKTAFLANMSHEIRTPLNGILGFADMLAFGDLSEEEKKLFVGIITESGNHLLNILNDVIDIARIETGQLDLNYGPVIIPDLMEELWRFHHPIARKKGLGLEFGMDPCIDRNPVRSDFLRLRQILSNLLGNAIKFTRSGGASYYCTVDKGSLRFTVSDTGPGIPEDKQETIFERFMQLNPGKDSVVSGNGLGLSICRAYVTALGGHIGFRNRREGGAEFFFHVPYCKIEDSGGE